MLQHYFNPLYHVRPFSKFIPGAILLIHLWPLRKWIYGTRLARMGQVKFVESNLWSWSILEYLDPYGTICSFEQSQSWPRRFSGKKCSKNITIFPVKQLWWSPFIVKLKAHFAVLLKGIYLWRFPVIVLKYFKTILNNTVQYRTILNSHLRKFRSSFSRGTTFWFFVGYFP